MNVSVLVSYPGGVAYVSNIRKFGPLFNGLTVLRAVFRMVFGFSARSRRGFRAGLAKWATVWGLFSGWFASVADPPPMWDSHRNKLAIRANPSDSCDRGNHRSEERHV